MKNENIFCWRHHAGKVYRREIRYKCISDVIPEILSLLEQSECKVANLESPVVADYSTDSLRFSADPSLLNQFKWVGFSLYQIIILMILVLQE